MNRKRARHVAHTLRQGPTEALYAALRARRRRRNVADEPVLDPLYDLDPAHLTAHAAGLREQAARDSLDVRTVQWFLPWFHLPHGGGVHTVLRSWSEMPRLT